MDLIIFAFMKNLSKKLFVILGVCLVLSGCFKQPAPKTPPTKFTIIGVWGVYGVTAINHSESLPKKEVFEKYSYYWTFQADGVFHYSRFSRENKPRTSGTYTYDPQTKTLTLHYQYGDKVEEVSVIPESAMDMSLKFYGPGFTETYYYLRKYDWDEEE